MKLLIINYEFPPIGGGGGKATQNLAISLAKQGHQVDILTSKYKSYKPEKLPKGINVHGVTSFRKSVHDCGIRGALSFLVFAIPRFKRLMKTESYDAIHYFFGLPTGFLLLFQKKRKDQPVLVSLRGSDVPGYDPYNKTVQILHTILSPITKTIWKKADHLVAVTQSLKDEAQKTDPKINIKVIPNGVEHRFFEAEVDRSKQNELKLITVARLIERKGVQHILKALKLLRGLNIHLTIIGKGNYEKQLKNLTTQLDIDNKVEFKGFVDPMTLPSELTKANVFILPSLAEAFGNVFAEAMAVGLPIIGTKIGGIEDLVGPENGILVADDENLDQNLSEAIKEFLKNPDLREKMGKRNAEIMRKSYQWDRVSERFLNLYRSQ